MGSKCVAVIFEFTVLAVLTVFIALGVLAVFTVPAGLAVPLPGRYAARIHHVQLY